MCCVKNIVFSVFVLLNVHSSFQCPFEEQVDAKAAYKAGEKQEQSSPITIDQIKLKLKESGIFDERRAGLTDRERKELKKLYDVVEIMTTSRNRQPQNVQNMFSSLRMMERVVKKQMKEGQLSETLAAKFQWQKLSNRQRREGPAYFLDRTTNMRVFQNDKLYTFFQTE